MTPSLQSVRQRWRRAVGAAWALAVAALAVFPLLYLLAAALSGPWPAPHLLPRSLHFDRARELLLSGSPLAASLLLSLLIAFATAALSTSLGFISSSHLARSPRRNSWLLLTYLPFAISPVVLAACLAFLFGSLALAGTVLGVVLAHTILAYAMAIILLVGLWSPYRRGLEDVARTLGATSRQVWLHVLLPSCLPQLRVCFFQTFLLSWVQYGLTLLIGAGKVQTLPLRVYGYAFEADLSYAALAGVVLVLPPFLMLWIERRVLFKVPA